MKAKDLEKHYPGGGRRVVIYTGMDSTLCRTHLGALSNKFGTLGDLRVRGAVSNNTSLEFLRVLSQGVSNFDYFYTDLSLEDVKEFIGSFDDPEGLINESDFVFDLYCIATHDIVRPGAHLEKK